MKYDSNGREEIILNVINNRGLDKNKQVLLRVFYWAAYFGKVIGVKYMIEVCRWSPMLKSYRKRDILSAAISGK